MGVLLQIIPNYSGKEHPWFDSNPEYYSQMPKADVEKSSWRAIGDDGPAWVDVGETSFLQLMGQDKYGLNFSNPDVVKEMQVGS